MARGLGKGLDSLIPNIYDEDFDSNSAQSLEDMMKEEEENIENVVEDIESKNVEDKESDDVKESVEEIESSEEDKNDKDDVTDSQGSEESPEEVREEQEEEESSPDDEASENLSSDKDSEEVVQTSSKIQVQQEHVDEVKEIVDKNPRITLWSSRSSAVFRYLRKTEPEFSISKEASVLIEEAVAKKYPEIWALFEDL